MGADRTSHASIVGIFLRVLFNQFRQDPIEVERITRLELAEAARRVRRELDSTVVDFGYFRRSAQQAIMEAFDEVKEQLDGAGNRILSGLEVLTTNAGASMKAVTRGSSVALEGLTRTMVSRVEASAEEIAVALESVTNKSSVALEELTRTTVSRVEASARRK
jgi:hypothetical protein